MKEQIDSYGSLDDITDKDAQFWLLFTEILNLFRVYQSTVTSGYLRFMNYERIHRSLSETQRLLFDSVMLYLYGNEKDLRSKSSHLIKHLKQMQKKLIKQKKNKQVDDLDTDGLTQMIKLLNNIWSLLSKVYLFDPRFVKKEEVLLKEIYLWIGEQVRSVSSDSKPEIIESYHKVLGKEFLQFDLNLWDSDANQFQHDELYQHIEEVVLAITSCGLEYLLRSLFEAEDIEIVEQELFAKGILFADIAEVLVPVAQYYSILRDRAEDEDKASHQRHFEVVLEAQKLLGNTFFVARTAMYSAKLSDLVDASSLFYSLQMDSWVIIVDSMKSERFPES
ncbi:MAG: hypothetical protein U9Q15_02965 [Patescibacteria group bacterium]|nr:hypothetical protein [Patescibacteria group bacterium]